MLISEPTSESTVPLLQPVFRAVVAGCFEVRQMLPEVLQTLEVLQEAELQAAELWA